VTVGGGVLGTGSAQPPDPPRTPDPQIVLLGELLGFMTRDTPSVERLVTLVLEHLGGLGISAVTVFALEPADGTLTVVAGPDDTDAGLMLAGRVCRAPAGGPPLADGNRLAARLRAGGQTAGVLVLTGAGVTGLRPEVVATVALHLATTLQALATERQRHYVTHATTTIRRLFEDGTVAASVEAAGELLARATAEAFRTEYAGLNLVGADGRIVHAIGVGLASELTEALHRSLIGKIARDSPVWRAAEAAGGPVLVGDVRSSAVRAGGFVQTMGLQAYVAMPLMSAGGPVGMVMCGDGSRTRVWSAQDRSLAGQLAVEGALIVDSARLRQAERAHLEALTHQAYHDALTGLPNRSRLIDRAGEAIEIAGATGNRLALLLLDLNGFKQVNDTAGHHTGDALLHAVGRRLAGALRDGDLVARLGGDEFAVLLTRDPDEQRATAIAERLHERLRQPYDIEDRPVTVGASIGVALFPADATDIESLLRAADAAMYRAKRDGGGVRPAG
jgi:diguanylate cyclase (GGDEF)-like protein